MTEKQVLERKRTAVNIATGDDGHTGERVLDIFVMLCKMTEKEYKKEDRDCDTLGFSFNKKEYAPSNQIINKTLYDYTQKYVDMNPELKSVYTFGLFYGFNLQRYKPNQCYRLPHTENNGIIQNRMMVWTIYLNTVTDGGGTYYTQYDKTIDAVEGRLVIWPAYWTHFHHGVVSKSQTKYIATGWYTFADVK